MRIRIESDLARQWNESLAPEEVPRDETWEGDVPEMSLEDVFRYFNRVDVNDGPRLEGIGYRLPSLSVGDRVTIDETVWEVAPVGWREIVSGGVGDETRSEEELREQFNQLEEGDFR